MGYKKTAVVRKNNGVVLLGDVLDSRRGCARGISVNFIAEYRLKKVAEARWELYTMMEEIYVRPSTLSEPTSDFTSFLQETNCGKPMEVHMFTVA